MQIAPIAALAILATFLYSCGGAPATTDNDSSTTDTDTEETAAAAPLFSFAFVGCNRVNYGDRTNTAATDGSTANVEVLKKTLNDIATQSPKPELFFFLGDMVEGESTTHAMDTQLGFWVNNYTDPSFSAMANAGIETVAVPGNHEMLYYNDSLKAEYPLAGSIEIWMQHMAPYMPADRDLVGGPDSVINQATFAFTRHNTGFIVMNTDTYDPPSTAHPMGEEGQAPTAWINAKVAEYKADAAIDHIFVLGHKPYYVNGVANTGHGGFADGPEIWPGLEANHVEAMLSAHMHHYQRSQPGNSGTYQVIAGNGGTDDSTLFFGYSLIHVMDNGEVVLESRGFKTGSPYYTTDTPNEPWEVKDSTVLTWSANANPWPLP